MRTLGAMMFMIGLGQAMFQYYLLLTGSYWSRFTVGDFLAELGWHAGYGGGWWGRVTDLMLGFEFSFTLLLLGTVMLVACPLYLAFQDWHAQRLIAASSRRPLPTPRRG